MREIKFRAWNNEMVYFDDINKWNCLEDAENFYFGISDNLMQYTGIKDKNGVDIYEGDIVRNQELVGEIYFEKGGFNMRNFYLSNQDNPGDAFGENATLEIIGNIYESPNLLK